jgi:hypothetical protein
LFYVNGVIVRFLANFRRLNFISIIIVFIPQNNLTHLKTRILKYVLAIAFSFVINSVQAAPSYFITGLNVQGSGFLQNGISPSAVPFTSSNIVLYGFSVGNFGSSSSTISQFRFTTTGQPIGQFFTNFRIYRSSGTNYTTSTNTLIGTAAFDGSSGTFVISGLAENIGVGATQNYFIVGDFTAAGNILPQTEKLQFADLTYTGGNVTSGTNFNNTAGVTFTLASPVLTISNSSTGVYTGTIIAQNTSYNLIGFTLSYSGPTNLHHIRFSLNYPSGGDKISNYVNTGNGVVLYNAATNTPVSGVTYSINDDYIDVLFGLAVQNTTTSYYLQFTFGSFAVHAPLGLNVCINSSSNSAANGTCGNNSNCTVVDNYLNSTSGTMCSQTFAPAIPYAITTNTSTAITTTTATIGGTVTTAGSPTATEYGVVYSSTNSTPTIADSKIAKGTVPTTNSAYTQGLTSLSSGTTYYYSAYVTNSSGTVYGSVLTFTTLPAAPTVPNVSKCGAGSIAITASGTPTGGSYKWYTVATGGTAISGATGATYSPNIPATDIFYVTTVTASGVESATRTAVTATIYPVVSSPFPNAYLSYSFNTASPVTATNTLDVSGTKNDGIPIASPVATTDRYGFANSAYSFNGSTQWFETTTQMIQPQTFTISAWINTNTTRGGVIVGYTNTQTGGGNHDRFIWMDNNGFLNFGVYSGATNIISTTTAFNDSQWHHIVATLSSAGTKLYVDNQLLASNSAYTAGETTNGYWGIGGGNASGWSPTPTSNFFSGIIDDVAIYSTDLSSSVTSMNDINQIGAYAPVCTGSALTIYAPTITGATFTWTDPNGSVVTGQNGVFPAAAAGSYSLAVTGGPGGCTSSASYTPTLYALPTAAFTAPAAVNINANATITISPASVVSGNTYSWSFDGGTATPTATNTSGPYTVKWTTYGNKNVVLMVTNANGCTATSTQTVTVGPNNTTGNYAFSQPITLNTSGAGISSTLTNFPALVYIKEDALKSAVNCANNVQSPTGGTNGYDFAFTLAGSTAELFYQVDSFDPTTGTLLAWVQLPSATAANTNLTFYFGSTTPAHTAAFTAATWYSDYQAVYHFNEGSAAATVVDATGNARNAAQLNTAIAPDEIRYKLGLTGGGYQFNGITTSNAAASSIMQNASTPTAMTGTFTLSAWVNTVNTNADYKVVTNETNYGSGYKMSVKGASTSVMNLETEIRSSTYPASQLLNVGQVTTTTNSTTNPVWHYIQSVYDGTNFINYIDGVNNGTATGYAPGSSSSGIIIGLDYRGTSTAPEHVFTGVLDEIRVSNVVKSADWVKLEYYNQTNPATFTNSSTAITANATVAAAIGGSIYYTWTGASTNPTSAANWKSAASGNPNLAPPYDGFCSLVIPGSLTNYPALTADASIYGLTLQSGSKFNLNGHNLNIGCNIYNSLGGQILYGTSPFTTDTTTANASGITWNGSGIMTSQTYTGTNTTATAQLGFMNINNATTGGLVTINGGPIDVYSELNITAGNLTIGTYPALLTLKSLAGQSANVGKIPAASKIDGLIDVERFITGGNLSTNKGYRLMSSPVNQVKAAPGTTASPNTFGLTYLKYNTYNNRNYDGVYTGSTLGSTAYGFSVKSVGPTVTIFDERKANNNKAYSAGKNIGVTTINTIGATTTATTSTVALTDLTAGTISLPVGNAFQMFFIGPYTSTTNAAAAIPTLPADATVTAHGYLNQGNITVNLWHTPTSGSAGQLSYTTSLGTTNAGFNMIGNPYPSTISLKMVIDSNSTSIDNIYLFNSKGYPNQTFVAYTPYGSSAPSAGYAVSGEGFFVHAIGTGKALIFKETFKASTVQLNGSALIMSAPHGESILANGTGTINKSFSVASTPPALATEALTGFYVKIEKDAATYNYCGIYFNDKWPATFATGDAVDLDGSGPQVMMSSFSQDGIRSAVKHFPDYKKEPRIIKLFADAKTDGMYTLKIEDLKNIDTVNYKITLYDRYKKDSLDIGRYKSYAFNIVKSDTASSGANRFELGIQQLPGLKYKLLSLTAQKSDQGVLVNWRVNNEGSNYFYTLEKQLSNSSDYTPIYQLQSDGSSLYSYTDKTPYTGNNAYQLKQVDLFGAITYAGPVNVFYDKTGSEGLFSIYPNPTAETLNVNITFGKTNNANGSYNLNIYDTAGNLVMKKTSTNIKWAENVSQFNPGVYIVEIKDNSGISLGKAKFVKK